jgi:hypothetical protein
VLWRTQYHNVGRVANFLKVRVIHDFTFGWGLYLIYNGCSTN